MKLFRNLNALLCPSFLLICLTATIQPAQALEWPWEHAQKQAEPAPPRPIVSVILSDQPQITRSVPGVIAAKVDVELGFQTFGRLIQRPADIGDIVQAGDLLAALDPEELQGNVAAAKAALAAAEVRLETARASADRARELARRNVTSVATLEEVENARIAAEAAAQQAQSELIRARDAEGYAQMTAPFDGVISDVYENIGAVVAAGKPVMKLSASDRLEAIIDLPESALAQVQIGDLFEVWSENAPDQITPADVRLIEPMADAATRTRRVRLSLHRKNGVRIGSLIRARPARNGGAVLNIPADAVLTTDGRDAVWVVTRKRDVAQVSLRPVTLQGPELGGITAVSAGLSAGDEIVIRGIHSLSEGQAVGRSVEP